MVQSTAVVAWARLQWALWKPRWLKWRPDQVLSAVFINQQTTVSFTRHQVIGLSLLNSRQRWHLSRYHWRLKLRIDANDGGFNHLLTLVVELAWRGHCLRCCLSYSACDHLRSHFRQQLVLLVDYLIASTRVWTCLVTLVWKLVAAAHRHDVALGWGHQAPCLHLPLR